MTASNVTPADLQSALDMVARLYGGNIIWNRPPEPIGNRYRFTLTVKDSSGPGGRRSSNLTTNGKHAKIHAACWHVHGHFFQYLYRFAPHAIIKTSLTGSKTITGPTNADGNWQDSNIGSIMYPMMHSEACECGGSQ